jgi:cytokinin dehydrogenase
MDTPVEVRGGLISRRRVLAGIAAGALVVGFDPTSKSWVREAEASSGGPWTKLPNLDGTIHLDLPSREAVSTDKGNLLFVTPAAVLRPGSVSDIRKMIRFCRKRGIEVAARGQAHTVFGHGLTAGLIIEMASLSTIHSIGPDGAEVDAGVQWRDLILEAFESGLTPPVLTGYTQLTIGGTLSVGGVSSTIGRGIQIGQVQWLDVVTGKGDIVRCSDTQRRRLFNAVLGGLGQCGIIVRAKVNLVPAPQFVRLYNIAYFDNAQFFADVRTLLAREEVQDIFNLWFPAGPAGFGYLLNVMQPFDGATPPDDAFLLRDLSVPASAATVQDIPYLFYALRVDSVVDQFQAQTNWNAKLKPWFDVWLPDSTVEDYIGQVIPTLTPADVGSTGFMLLFPQKRSLIDRPFYPVPDACEGEWIYLFDILTTSEAPGPDPVFQSAMLDRNRALFELARDLGGKRYSIGALEFDQADWCEHFGEAFDTFRKRKKRFDPDNILTPGLGIFPTLDGDDDDDDCDD